MIGWPSKGQLSAGGRMLEWGTWGPPPGDGPTLVLLHEGLGSLALWREFPEALVRRTGLGVFAYSRAGYGHSDPARLPRPKDYMTCEAVDVLPEVLAAAGIGPAILIGHSDGATIAAIHAGCIHGSGVRGLVLMAPHFFTEPEGVAQIARIRAAFETGGLAARMARYHQDPAHTFYGWNDAWLAPEFETWEVLKEIEAIRVPVLAIQGRDDEYGTLAQIEALEARASGPVERLVLENVGHGPHAEAEEPVLKAIAAFCTRFAPAFAAATPYPLPGHAYIPGKTARHPDGAFDEIRETARPGQSASELAGSPAFQVGVQFLHAGYHWEAHELLEPVWMALPDGSMERQLVQCLIQIANGYLKLRMDRPRAAIRLAGIARDLLPDENLVMGIRRPEVLELITGLEH